MNTNRKFMGYIPTEKEMAYRSVVENGIIGREMFNFLCGNLLGYGVSRMVFDYRPDPSYVIKIETDDYNANVMEWHLWCHVQYTDFARWFAPCKELSTHGRILIQKKISFPEDRSKYPDKMPIFFSDFKYQNYGIMQDAKFGKRFVCSDYAGCLLPTTGLTKKMGRVKWWEG